MFTAQLSAYVFSCSLRFADTPPASSIGQQGFLLDVLAVYGIHVHGTPVAAANDGDATDRSWHNCRTTQKGRTRRTKRRHLEKTRRDAEFAIGSSICLVGGDECRDKLILLFGIALRDLTHDGRGPRAIAEGGQLLHQTFLPLTSEIRQHANTPAIGAVADRAGRSEVAIDIRGRLSSRCRGDKVGEEPCQAEQALRSGALGEHPVSCHDICPSRQIGACTQTARAKNKGHQRRPFPGIT
jgi:hypothetical protein